MTKLKQMKEILFNSHNQEGQRLCDCQIINIPCDRIRPNRTQPRAEFNGEALLKLANSIARYGMVQPLTVRKADIDDIYEYELIAGERRLRAAKLAELYYVPCIITTADDQLSAELAIVENLMREDLNMFELAYGLRNLIEDFSLTQEEIARKLSMSQSTIANKLRLLRLDYKEQQAILALSLTERHARALLRLEDGERRMAVIYKIAELGLNVRETEEYIEDLIAPSTKLNAAEELPREINRSASSIIKGIQKRLETFNKGGKEAKMEIESKESRIELHITIPK